MVVGIKDPGKGKDERVRSQNTQEFGGRGRTGTEDEVTLLFCRIFSSGYIQPGGREGRRSAREEDPGARAGETGVLPGRGRSYGREGVTGNPTEGVKRRGTFSTVRCVGQRDTGKVGPRETGG